jgi:hypothetical protein
MYVKNNVIVNTQGIGQDCVQSTGTINADYNASVSAFGTNHLAIVSWVNQFYDATYQQDANFRLKQTSTLLGAGVGPSVDAYVPVTDIVGYSRSGDTATVGPFQYYWNYNPYTFPSDPYDGEEHRTVGSGSLYVYDASRIRWVKSTQYSKGVTGTLGVTGAITYGQQGSNGVAGATGVVGLVGIPGATGVGAPGVTGVYGITGVDGLTGSQGFTGPDAGVTGYINFVMNNPSTGIAGQIRLPYPVRFGSWETVSSDVTTFRADVRIGPYSTWPPSYSMNGAATGPHIGSAFKNADYDLSDWVGTTGACGDWLQLNVLESDSPESITVALGYYQT